MAISRYWRLVGICTSGNGALELSEARIYEHGALADAGATLTATIAPVSGSMADLRDGVASGAVSWPYASYSQPGFALVWDFGAGQGVETPGLRLGSGSIAATFPLNLIFQGSQDGTTWVRYTEVSGVSYPGNNAMMAAPPTGVPNPYFSKTALLVHGTGVEGSTTLVDISASPKTMTASGAAHLGAAPGHFGGSALLFDGSGSYWSTPGVADFVFGVGDFSLTFRVKTTDSNCVILDFYTSSNLGWQVFVTASGYLQWYTNTPVKTGSIAVNNGALHHCAIVRSAGLLYFFVDGVQDGAPVSHPTNLTYLTTALSIGAQVSSRNATYDFAGELSEIMVLKGGDLYTGNFPVPAEPYSSSPLLMVTGLTLARQLPSTFERLLPAVTLPDSAAVGHTREHTFFDAYNGGIGTVTGTVKEKNTPANTPLSRRVLLIDEASRMTIRETWSDAITGNYEFRGVKQGVKYTVISYDHLHNYRAVIADNQDAI